MHSYSNQGKKILRVLLIPFLNLKLLYNNGVIKKIEEGKFNILYRILYQENQVYSLDEINLIFQKFFLKKEFIQYSKRKEEEKCYLKLLKELSLTFITHRDGKLTFKYWKTEKNKLFNAYTGVNKVLLWSSLNQMIPTDILGVLYFLENGMRDEYYLEGYYSYISLGDNQLESVLKKGIAETHLHISASTDFYTSWKNLMNLYRNDENPNLLYSKLVDNKYDMNLYQKVGAIYRLIMADYLSGYSSNSFGFADYLDEVLIGIDYSECNINSCNNSCEKVKGKNYRSIYKENLDLLEFLEGGKELEEGFFEQYTSEDLRRFYKVLVEDILGLEINSNDSINDVTKFGKDILDYIFFEKNEDCKSGINTYTENIFLMKALKHLEIEPFDKTFAEYFFNYLRIKNEFFSLMVQGNQIKGLDNFVEYFSRSTKLGRDYKDILWEERLRAQCKDKNLKKLEIRISPALEKNLYQTKKQMKNELIKIFTAYKAILETKWETYEGKYSHIRNGYGENIKNIISPRMEVPYLGIVYHFIKAKDKDGSNKCWKRKVKDEYDRSGLAYDFLSEKYRMQSDAIKELRAEVKGLHNYIVGIDGASVENFTEPWVFAPIYDEIRDSKDTLYSKDYYEPLKTLGFTFHAGEDFRHILTGLRRIDETIEHFKYHSGDRIGHGIALGVDVEKWRKNHPVVILPRMEYLENLIWVWGSCKNMSTNLDMGYLERKIMDIAKDIYGKIDGLNVFKLWEAYRKKFKRIEIDEVWTDKDYIPECDSFDIEETIGCYNCGEKDSFWDVDKLSRAYHCKKYLEKMEEPIQVEVPKEKISLLEEMQKTVTKKVSRMGIVVETNPTSNTSIGEVENIFNHYITKLNKIKQNNYLCGEEEMVMVSINTDDPSVFNSNLSNEFAYIFYSLVEKGYPKELVLQWIDKVRQHGMNSSFVDDRRLSLLEVKLEIEEILEGLKPNLIH